MDLKEQAVNQANEHTAILALFLDPKWTEVIRAMLQTAYLDGAIAGIKWQRAVQNVRML